MKNSTKRLNLAKMSERVLTFSLSYAILILEYIGIVVYFAGQKSYSPRGKEAQPNKKQNKKPSYQNSGLALKLHVGLIAKSESSENIAAKARKIKFFALGNLFYAFCFWSKRFLFAKKGRFYTSQKIKNKKKSYDSRLLSTTRHFATNRSQQDNLDSLGRRGLDSSRAARQPRLALLFQRTSGANYLPCSGNQLLPQRPWCLQTTLRRKSFCPSLSLLSFFICKNYVFSRTTQLSSFISLENILTTFSFLSLKSKLSNN